MNKVKRGYLSFGIAATLLSGTHAQADLADLQGQFDSELEELSAISNQLVYDQLKAKGCRDSDKAATANCAGGSFIIWNNVRELVHTANDISGSGPTEYSLDNSLEGLGFALRWTAGEEFSSQESMTNSFTGGQLTSLSGRITALRSGARGFNVASNVRADDALLASAGPSPSGLNSGDATQTDNWSRLGGFINGSYTYGDQRATEREDAFDFDGSEINAGLDYRIDDHWVVGGLLGHLSQEIDFDATQSIVDGGVTMDGWSVMPFALYQGEQWYSSLSAGYQTSEFTTERSIRYPSQNPDVDSVNTTAISSNNATTLSANLVGGYSFQVTDAFSIEPSLSVNYQRVAIDQYSETDLQNDGFNFIVLAQDMTSLETTAALKMQYVISTPIGVLMPFIDVQSFAQHKTDAHTIDAVYVNVAEIVDANARFSLPTNNPDSDYKMYSVGIAAVLRGASQDTLGAAANGGIQAFINYREIADVGNYQQRIFSGGIRYEF